MTSSLFSPFQIGSLTLDNRIVLSPMCQYAAADGCATDWHLMHLGQYSQSGLGLMFTEMTNVEPRGRITANCMGLYDDRTESSFKRVIDHCRSISDTPIGVQLAHAGRKSSSSVAWKGWKQLAENEGGWETVGPSAISHKPGARPPRELTLGEIEGLIEKFVRATERAARIGFDAIELHAAHGYLLHQFLSPIANQRDDDYGGSRENRWRIVLEIFDAVRAIWPRPLGVRLSAIDWLEGGISIEDTVALAELLERRGCDFVDVSTGGISHREDIAVGPGYQVPFAERVRADTGLRTVAVGKITEPQQAEAIISQGQADMVALARGLLYNPRWPWHAADVLGVEIEYPDRYKRCSPHYRPPG